jgi:hypothetical protein
LLFPNPGVAVNSIRHQRFVLCDSLRYIGGHGENQMQFGKFHAWAFIALGALLVVVQLALFFSTKQDIGTPESPAVARHTTSLPGIVGGLSLALGVALYVANRNKPQE